MLFIVSQSVSQSVRGHEATNVFHFSSSQGCFATRDVNVQRRECADSNKSNGQYEQGLHGFLLEKFRVNAAVSRKCILSR